MKKYLFMGILTIFLTFFSFDAFCDNKDAGFGIILGEPTGFSGKVWWDNNVAFDGGVAWSFRNDSKLSLHSDVLWHNWSVLQKAFEIDKGKFPLYYGLGCRIKTDNDTRAGLRIVAGASYMFDNAPFDVFFEVAPIMDFAPETKADFNASFGVRIWF